MALLPTHRMHIIRQHCDLAAVGHTQRTLLCGKLPDFSIIVLILAAAGVKQEPAEG